MDIHFRIGGLWSYTCKYFKSNLTNSRLQELYASSVVAAKGYQLASPQEGVSKDYSAWCYVDATNSSLNTGSDNIAGIQNYGYRPVIALKTGIQFTANADGTYTIVN